VTTNDIDVTPFTVRAGHYVRQLSGYRAFMPSDLPPDPPVRLEGGLQALLSEADRALGRLDGSIQTLPNPDLFVFMYVRKEAVLSSQIEGTQSSLQDLLSAEAEVLSVERPRDVAEVVNYVSAMNQGLARLAELPVSIRLIRDIHGILMEGVRGSHLTPGELRRSQNWIGPGGATLANASFVPPPPEEVPRVLGQLENFLHETESSLPILLKVGLAHAQFETIHPFLDGNGRMGRLLITFLLREQGVLAKPVLYLSHFFKENRTEYYERLQAVRDNGAWEEWLAFFLRGVAKVSIEATETARRILKLREEFRATISDRFGHVGGNGHRVLDHLWERPILSVADVAGIVGVTYPAANQLVSRFTEAGILKEITGHSRNRRFILDRYLRLFDD